MGSQMGVSGPPRAFKSVGENPRNPRPDLTYNPHAPAHPHAQVTRVIRPPAPPNAHGIAPTPAQGMRAITPIRRNRKQGYPPPIPVLWVLTMKKPTSLGGFKLESPRNVGGFGYPGGLHGRNVGGHPLPRDYSERIASRSTGSCSGASCSRAHFTANFPARNRTWVAPVFGFATCHHPEEFLLVPVSARASCGNS